MQQVLTIFSEWCVERSRWLWAWGIVATWMIVDALAKVEEAIRSRL